MMADDPPNPTVSEQKSCDQASTSEPNAVAEITQLKWELEIVKNANPFRMAEIALELQIERLRVMEITRARDTALQRLSECCMVIRQKNEFIERLQENGGNNVTLDVSRQMHQFSGETADVEKLKAHICSLETRNEELQLSVAQLRATATLDLPPSYEANGSKVTSVEAAVQTDVEENTMVWMKTGVVPAKSNGKMQYTPPRTDNPEELLNARNAFLASIPLPGDLPDATLSAFIIPPPFTIQDFLASVPASLRAALGDHKVLHSATTHWCPEREENGYMYCPIFKCSTNPRAATAHRWMAVDVIACMDKPTECFYDKGGVWYYAGTYEAFQMDKLSVKEWEQLPAETTSAIVKETLAGRKHACPQNTYETTQLYAAGALTVACVALLCVGFNQEVYNTILEHSVKFSESKWKSLANVSAKVLSGGFQSNPNVSKENGSTPLMRTPNHFLRTPGPSNPSSTNGSPSPRGGHFGMQNHFCASPPLGLGFGSSTWSMASNGRVNSMISSGTHDLESLELPAEYLKGDAYEPEFTLTKL